MTGIPQEGGEKAARESSSTDSPWEVPGKQPLEQAALGSAGSASGLLEASRQRWKRGALNAIKVPQKIPRNGDSD